MHPLVNEIVAQSSQQDGWLLNGGGWGVLALINAGLAEQKNRSRLAWFLSSLLLGPFATFLIVVMAPVSDLPLVPRHPLLVIEDRYIALTGIAAAFTAGAVLIAVVGQTWYMWVISGVLAAVLVLFIVKYRRARAKRLLALTEVDAS